ncbi:MAG: AhpC/TSA family protein [Bacteroidales bacterium]|nr:AhpC/TSA family protein [Bacteroidales bacterium]
MKTFILVILLCSISAYSLAQEVKGADDIKGLAVGTRAPLFTALDANSKAFSLETSLKEGPVVMIFYRGYWCPVCNKHLAAIQDSLKQIEAKGATVIAISPEKPEYLDEMAEKSGAQFHLLYDDGYKIADAYDVNFTPKKTELFIYNTVLGAKLKKTHSDDSQRLPIPATYLIDKEGRISWRQFDPDYKNRSSVKDIIAAIDKL